MPSGNYRREYVVYNAYKKRVEQICSQALLKFCLGINVPFCKILGEEAMLEFFVPDVGRRFINIFYSMNVGRSFVYDQRFRPTS